MVLLIFASPFLEPAAGVGALGREVGGGAGSEAAEGFTEIEEAELAAEVGSTGADGGWGRLLVGVGWG